MYVILFEMSTNIEHGDLKMKNTFCKLKNINGRKIHRQFCIGVSENSN